VRHSAHKKCGKSYHRFLAHQRLFNNHGILHRDISLNNILLYRAEDETADGLLIDFDYSEELDILDRELDALDTHSDGEAMEECGDEIDEAADVEEGEASAIDSETAFGIDSVRTVRSHFIICINCPRR
jgi:serine/threonine protein kinase